MCEYVVFATAADGSWYISLILDRGNITVNQWNSFQTTHTHTVCVLNVVNTWDTEHKFLHAVRNDTCFIIFACNNKGL